jgi:hypothetical protein
VKVLHVLPCTIVSLRVYVMMYACRDCILWDNVRAKLQMEAYAYMAGVTAQRFKFSQ